MSDTHSDPGRTREAHAGAEPLLPLLREATRELHTAAEQSGIYRALLTGRAERCGYTLLLRNLEPIYRVLERELSASSALRALVPPVLFRSAALVSDLETLVGPHWRDRLPELGPSRGYADHLETVARDAPPRLIAHVYTRYLGDLAGGRVLHSMVRRQFCLGPESLAYFSFAGHAAPASLALELREGIERAGTAAVLRPAIIDEARTAFRLTTDLSTAVQAAVEDALHPSP